MIDVHLPTTDERELILTRYTQPETDCACYWNASNSDCPSNRRRKSQPKDFAIDRPLW
jgi:hypothetical protein